ncbi:MAG: transglycosylase SLT domain-containing protein [Flavobacteriales bacterium]|nr:transglycosylase SLT domain-containing protein [Flavobacteriales bacterium]
MTGPLRHPLLRGLLLALLVSLGALVVHLFTFGVVAPGSDIDHQRAFNDGYRIFSLTLPDELSLCDEAVPLEKLDVRERLDRELLVNTYWQSNTLLAHKRAARWFPVIAPILAREGVPDDMKYLALIESGLTNVVSPVGATGFWQFMKETAIQHGLEVNGEVDERYNVVRSTEAACRYLKESRAKYGSWAMAAASYNLGPGGVEKQIDRQGTSDYYAMQLPEETSRYVFRMLAMKEIITDPERYGFHLRSKDLYEPYRTRAVEISGPIEDLAAWAVRQGTNYRTLKLLNPWLRDNKLTNAKGRTYTVLLPADDFDRLATDEE